MLMRKILLAVASASVLATGCAHAGPPKDGAVVCDKCKIVVVKIPSYSGLKGQTYVYHDVKTMVCPDCKLALENFFTTGKLKHTCSRCGGKMTVCVH